MSRKNLYVGKSGQMAVIAEFLARGYNVAIPEVDVGDDIFVVRDSDGNLNRIQVKTANARASRNGYSTRFSVSLKQLQTPRTPDLYYVFVVRHEGSWKDFLVISRDQLLEERTNNKIGTPSKGMLSLYFSFTSKEVICSKQSLEKYRNNWSKWPEI
jgi:hypothetical protein